MNSARPEPVVIGTEGRKWWEFPDALWQKIPALQRRRLRRTVSTQILPLLSKLDDLVPRAKGSKLPRISGRSLEQIETDVPCTMLAMKIFELAMSEGLLSFKAEAKGKGKAKKPSPKTPVGSCGLNLAEAQSIFLKEAAKRILADAGHDPKKLDEMLGTYEMREPENLHKLEMMVMFNPLTLSELRGGLSGRMGKLFDMDDTYFNALKECKPTHFMRPLRVALDKDFPKILEWDGEYMKAISEGLEHSAKIVALGKDLLKIEDPDVIRALGKWPMKEVVVRDKEKGKKKSYVTRIGDVRMLLGEDFSVLLESGPFVISIAGKWSDDDFEKMKFYMPYLNSGMMKALAKLPPDYGPSILDGLWEKCGRRFFEEHAKTSAGQQALLQIVTKIEEMGVDKTPPDAARGLIVGQFMDDYLAKFT